jgi:hypothetical protein
VIIAQAIRNGSAKFIKPGFSNILIVIITKSCALKV